MRAREMGMRDADAVIRMADRWKIGSRCQSSSRYMVKERTRLLSMRGWINACDMERGIQTDSALHAPSGTGILRGYPSMPTHSCFEATSAMIGSCSTGCTHSGLGKEER